jgi:RNA exonuclease 4
MATARDFETVQKDVADLLEGRILVGHALKHDLEVLFMSHPKKDLRDTSRFGEFRKMSGGRTPSLKKLAKDILGIDIQGGEHSSVCGNNPTHLCASNWSLDRRCENIYASLPPL